MGTTHNKNEAKRFLPSDVVLRQNEENALII